MDGKCDDWEKISLNYSVYSFIPDEMLNELTPIMKKLAPRRIPVPDVLYEYFIIRSRANLHVVLCFSPVRPL